MSSIGISEIVAISSDRERQGDSLPTAWSLSRESSIKEIKFKPCKWAGIESRSHALLAQDDSFTEVERVAKFLRGNDRLGINTTAGFHVNVGLGSGLLPPHAILRLTKLLWCAEGRNLVPTTPSRKCQSCQPWQLGKFRLATLIGLNMTANIMAI